MDLSRGHERKNLENHFQTESKNDFAVGKFQDLKLISAHLSNSKIELYSQNIQEIEFTIRLKSESEESLEIYPNIAPFAETSG
ncbi:hypothetical protein [Leptospira weilii]|uniref:Uncharacterized protein n=2 Tax=Leptospira weilii TaxID=28184 RepID=M6QSS1_9LEPT|nr:hypothetical protein [Leptospira weilii]EMM72999.1 hypothetical protein LEP1GSC038_4634 [Leptospira weilii str. 2006001855]EMN91877.1 hypothetical protein LEP1GSC108_1751 [Leptospira weilii str. UI 13098]OMI17545.1 hypothetical protein BUQ74_09440 [Leptospira weilii serovar Heyan]ULH28557.1 hypothetical protein FH586_19990 [Leptospira weilii]